MTKEERKTLKEGTFKGWELVQSTARLCAMNLMLHGIGGGDSALPLAVSDSLAADPGERFDIILTNPPFGKKSSTTIVAEDGKINRETETIERDDFWATTATSSSTSCSTSRPCSSSTAAPPWWCRTTSSSKAGQGRPSAASCCTNATSTPCCACRPASSTPRG